MKKLLLLLSFLSIAFAASAAAYTPATGNMNPFAYDLKSTYDEANMTLSFEFKVNAPAKSIRVYAKDSQDRTYLLDEQTTATNTAITYSVKNINLRDKGLPVGEDFTWYVDVEGTSHSNALFVSNSNKLYYPTSIDIDNNPENRNFGTVFCIEGRNNGANISGYISNYNNNGTGLYVFNADGTKRRLPRKSIEGWGLTNSGDKIYDVERYGWNGGKSLNANLNIGSTTGFGAYRVRVSDDGRIFITSQTSGGEVLYEANKNVFSDTDGSYWDDRSWYRVISVNGDDGKANGILTCKTTKHNVCGHTWDYCNVYNLYNTNNEFVAGPNVGFDVRGSGNDLQLLMLSGCRQAIDIFTPSHFYCSEYNLGTAATWGQAPTSLFKGYVVRHNGAQVQYDKYGNVWLCQHLTTSDNDSYTSLWRYDKNNKTITEILPKQRYHRCGAIRFNENFDKLAIAVPGTTGKGGTIAIYDLDPSNCMPIDNSKTEINIIDQVGASMMDFAWDHANNLYVVADGATQDVPSGYDTSKGHCVAIYAMPNNSDNVVSTPAASKYKFSTKYSVAWKNLFMYGLDIADDTKNYLYPKDSNTKIDYAGTNNRLWRLLQVGYNRYCESNGKSKRGDFESVSTTTAQLNVSSFFTINDGVVYDFFTKDSYFSWLGDYFSKISGVSTIAMCAQNADEFINRKGNFVEYGKPQYWRPMWAEAVCGLPATMDPNANLPVRWNWKATDEQYFDTYWVAGWTTYVNPTTYGRVDYVYYSCPSQWYDFNTVRWRQNEGLSDDTHILAWRDGGVDGNIVHRVTRPNMELYATYVEKNIDENNPPANPANFDATNEDLFQLLDNRNFKPDDPSVAPTHDLTVTRYLAAGMYNTICLPMNIDLAGLQEETQDVDQHPLKYKADGSGATVLEFTGVTRTTNAAGENVTVLNFTQVTRMVAGKPYLVKLRDGAEDYTEKMPFTAVSVHADEYHPVEYDDITFVPTINPTTIPAGSIILVADNRLALTTEEGQMAGLRGYFTVAPAQAKEIAEQAADGRVLFSVKRPVSTSVVVAPESEKQNAPKVQKLLHDGQIYIIRDNNTYTITGVRVK